MGSKGQTLVDALEAAQIGTWRVDLAKKVDTRDARMNRILGLAPEESTQSWDDTMGRVHPDDVERLRDAFERALVERGAYDEELRIVRPDGEVRWLRGRGRVLCDDAGLATTLIGASVDITEGKRAQLRAERLQTLVAELADVTDVHMLASAALEAAMISVSADAGVVCYEQGGELEVAHSANYAEGEVRPYRRIPLDTSSPLGRAFVSGEPVFVESREALAAFPEMAKATLRHRAWAALPLLVHKRRIGVLGLSFAEARPFTGEDRALLVTVARQCAQASERARLAGVERAATERLALLAEATRRFAAGQDVDEVLAATAQLVSARLAPTCAIFCVAPDGRRLVLGALHHPDPGVAAEIRRMFDETPLAVGEGFAGQVVAAKKPMRIVDDAEMGAIARPEHVPFVNRRKFAPALGVPLQAFGETLGVIVAARSGGVPFATEDELLLADLAERVAMTIASLRRREEAEAASRAKDEFLAMLGHELRNPLSPILTALQLMEIRAPEMFSRERGVIDRQVRHIVRLVDDLLDLSRISRSKVELQMRRVDLARIVAGAIEMATPLVEQRRHRLVVDLPSSGVVVVGDETRLTQVLSNIVTNAAKYTEPGGRIDVTLRRENDRAVVRVKDTGVGLEPELAPKIFDLFVQGERRLERESGGLGLGLAIVKALVDVHDGRVSAHSEGRGKGTELVVDLPVADGAPAEIATPCPPPPVADNATARKVLVVDDNEDAAQLLADALRLAGHDVKIAGDGAKALDVARVMHPDVILLDIGLPLVDGYEVARRYRAAGGTSLLVAVTGFGHETDRARTAAAGFDRHVVKPVDLPALMRLVEEAPRAPS